MYECLNCGIEFEAKRKARYCSLNCRVTANRKGANVTDNVTFSAPAVTDKFKFTVKQHSDKGRYDKNKDAVREEVYWYNVPLAAVPVYQKDWPKMPEFMNGRQYFLWWKNGFKENNGVPEILNPFPPSDQPVVYLQAGDGSRRWGA